MYICAIKFCVVMVTAGKPNPPRQISITTHNSHNYTYLVKWSPPVVSSSSVLDNVNYQVQISWFAQENAMKSCFMFPVVRENSVIFDAKSSLDGCMMCSDMYECDSELISTLSIQVAAFYLETPLVTSDSTSSCFSVSEGKE